jgi:DNA-binding NtrC family response regulator
MIERAVVTAAGSELTRQDFFGCAATAQTIDANLRSIARTASQAAERTRIQEALREASGNKTRAASLLQISRAGLYNKLKAYQIE